MTRRTYKLHVIKVRRRIVAIVPAKDLFEAIIEYTTRTGFAIYPYLCSHLMTNTVTFTTRTNNSWKVYLISVDTKTIGDAHLIISSQQVTNCNDIFKMIDYTDINNPLLVRPTIEEVRNCVGFSRTAIRELRKFCI